MTEDKSKTTKATIAITVATTCWGLSYVFTKFALAEISPFVLLGLRIVIASIIMYASLVVSNMPIKPYLKYLPQAFVLALGGVITSQLGFVVGLSYTSPAHGALIYTLLPIFTVILAIAFRNEKITLWRAVGIMVAFLGAVLLASEKGIDFQSDYFIGDLIMIGAVLGWAFYTVFSKPLIEEIGTRRTLTLTFLCAVPIAIPISIMPIIELKWMEISITAWSAAAYLILFGTVLAAQTFTYSLKHLSSTTVAVFVYLQPVIAAISTVIFLGEELSLRFLVSAALIFAGLIIFRLKPKRKIVPM